MTGKSPSQSGFLSRKRLEPEGASVLGLDLSLTSTGYAYRLEGQAITGTITTGKLRGPHRLAYIRNAILRLLADSSASLVVLEDYARGVRKGSGRLTDLGELGGVVRLAIWEKGCDHTSMAPATLKSVVAGHGKADKRAVQESLLRTYGYSVTQNDEADALALMLIGEAILGSEELQSSKKRLSSAMTREIVRGQRRLQV